LDHLTRQMSSGIGQTVDLTPVEQRIEGLERTLRERSAGGVDFGPLMDRFKDMENRISDNSLVIEAVGDRIDTFESNVDATRAQLAQTSSALGTEIKAVASAVSAQAAAGERLQRTLAEGMAMGGGAGGAVDPEAIKNVMAQPLQKTLEDVRTLVNADRKEQRDQFEYLVQGLGKSADEHRSDLGEVHEAMLKLNGNQQTLAQSMDRWRLDVSGDLGVLATRIEQLEGSAGGAVAPALPDPRIDALQSKLDNMTGYLEADRRRDQSSFAMWLFGTEDWWSDGWRTAEEREQAAIDDGRLPARADNAYLRPEDRRLRG
ncbi:MAG: hypothetical protein AAFR55_03760, partial [Pseudomonadota bacterium]